MTSEHLVDLLIACGVLGTFLAVLCLMTEPPLKAPRWTFGWFLAFAVAISTFLYVCIVIGVLTVRPIANAFAHI